MSSLPVEVRQCPKCQQPAVVLVMEWEHTSSGIDLNQSTREYRCQSCGAWRVKLPRFRVLAYWIVGVMLSLACFPGVPFLLRGLLVRALSKLRPIAVEAIAQAPRDDADAGVLTELPNVLGRLRGSLTQEGRWEQDGPAFLVSLRKAAVGAKGKHQKVLKRALVALDR